MVKRCFVLRRPDRRPALRVWRASSEERGDRGRGRRHLCAQAVERRARLCLGLVRARRSCATWLGDRDGAVGRVPSGRWPPTRSDRHGAGVAAARCSMIGGHAMSAGYVRSVFDQYAANFDRSLLAGARLSRRRNCCAQSVAEVCRTQNRAARFRHHARSRLRHRACRRRVPATGRLAGRRRSLARHDRARAAQRISTTPPHRRPAGVPRPSTSAPMPVST